MTSFSFGGKSDIQFAYFIYKHNPFYVFVYRAVSENKYYVCVTNGVHAIVGNFKQLSIK